MQKSERRWARESRHFQSQSPLDRTGGSGKMMGCTDGDQYDPDHDEEDEHEPEHPPPCFALVLVCGRQLLGGRGRVRRDGGDVGFDVVYRIEACKRRHSAHVGRVGWGRVGGGNGCGRRTEHAPLLNDERPEITEDLVQLMDARLDLADLNLALGDLRFLELELVRRDLPVDGKRQARRGNEGKNGELVGRDNSNMKRQGEPRGTLDSRDLCLRLLLLLTLQQSLLLELNELAIRLLPRIVPDLPLLDLDVRALLLCCDALNLLERCE